MLFFRVFLMIVVGCFDPFEKIIWTRISLDPNLVEDSADIKASALADAVSALVWQAISFATPNIKDICVDISVENFTHDGTYCTNVLPPNVVYNGWAPELRDIVNAKGDQIRDDLSAMLTDMAIAHLNGDDGSGDPRYEIRRRR